MRQSIRLIVSKQYFYEFPCWLFQTMMMLMLRDGGFGDDVFCMANILIGILCIKNDSLIVTAMMVTIIIIVRLS